MTRRLPSLNALRAFEAAARHLSFTKAAEELHVTQAAISHQVKSLEEQLGLPLFRRLNRRLLLTDAGQTYVSSLTLTDAGQTYVSSLTEAFDGIAEATERTTAQRGGSLRVSTLPSMAAKWLLPRLSRFRARHPEIDVYVSASHGLADFRRDDLHLAIRYGKGNYPGLEAVHNRRDWRAWLERIGETGIDPDRGPGFSDSNLIIEAVMAGEGVALTRRSLAADDLAAGRLAIPFGPIRPATNCYYIVYPKANAEIPKLRTFTDWLHEEAEADRAAGPLDVKVARP
jgi:LysR family glycine cleavage system transcriptional activator